MPLFKEIATHAFSMNNKTSTAKTATSYASQENATTEPLRNWAGNLRYSTNTVHHPTTIAEVQETVRKCNKLRVLGSRHSFNQVADSAENLVSLQAFDRIMNLDKERQTVTVEGGVRYGDLAPYLHENGFALPNLASLPHITIVGACATATHGSGIKNQSLASSISAIEFVDANGDVVLLSKNKDEDAFQGAVVNLGTLGAIASLTLDLVPTFEMKQVVYLDLPMNELKDHFDKIQAEGYSVSLFTDWKNQNIGEVWIKSKVNNGKVLPENPDLYGAKLATEDVHPITGQSAENVTEQKGFPGPWYARLPHFKMGFKPSAGEELQSEYFLRIEEAHNAMMAIEKLNKKISPHLLISEIRTIAADDFWLSPFYQRASVAFHFTWKQDVDAVMRLLPLIEAQLAPFDPRPHWGKLFAMPPKILQSKYPKLQEFKKLAQHYDPKGKFRNEFVDKYIFQ